MVAKVLGFKFVKEMYYLGIKITLRKLVLADFQDLLSHVTDRLNVWGKKSLSLGGRITLINTSLISMQNFLLTHSLVPKRVLYELKKICRRFICTNWMGRKVCIT
ncbi:Putative ribonuclease H protein [Dendrobium catenatum]|uniref:Ribonuclease H protein n=1 Tax=Dendrobium catenatum TaxID=906689 RepID=A0A2I0XFJ7_9ASPA|nr:Putative ribonuclease H protein [Dendrobium catenatum]